MVESIIYLFKARVKNQLCKVEQYTPRDLAKNHTRRGKPDVQVIGRVMLGHYPLECFAKAHAKQPS
jgi:hypothetical protein